MAGTLDGRFVGAWLALGAASFAIALMALSFECDGLAQRDGVCIPEVAPAGPVLAFLCLVAAFACARGTWWLSAAASLAAWTLALVSQQSPWLLVPAAAILGIVTVFCYEARFTPGRRLPQGRIVAEAPSPDALDAIQN